MRRKSLYGKSCTGSLENGNRLKWGNVVTQTLFLWRVVRSATRGKRKISYMRKISYTWGIMKKILTPFYDILLRHYKYVTNSTIDMLKWKLGVNACKILKSAYVGDKEIGAHFLRENKLFSFCIGKILIGDQFIFLLSIEMMLHVKTFWLYNHYLFTCLVLIDELNVSAEYVLCKMQYIII